MVHVRRGGAQAHLLVRTTADDPVPPGWESHPVGLEELALAYLREPETAAQPGPIRGLGVESSEVDEMTAITTLTVPLHNQEEDASLRPVPWRRMVWVTWRQHRVALIGMVAALVAIGAYTLMVGVQLHHAYAAELACRARGLRCLPPADEWLQ